LGGGFFGMQPGAKAATGSNRSQHTLDYTEFRMRTSAIAAFIVAFCMLGFAAVKQYQNATIVKIEEKTNTRVVYWVVNTPITKDEPYYEVSLRSGDIVYLARYTPRHVEDNLPSDWSAGSAVQFRVRGRHVFVQQPGAGEVELVLTKRRPIAASERNPQPASAEK
jgi:hypothetical protein